MLQQLVRPPTASPLSLRACLVIATVFWIHVSIARSARWELLRQAIADAGISPPDQIALTSALLFVPLWLLSIVSWRVGYDLGRWPKVVAAHLALALAFGATCRFAMFMALTLLHDVSFIDAMRILDGLDSDRATKFWVAGIVEHSAQYLVLQGILTGAAFYVRLKEEQALRERLAREYDRTRLQVLRMQTNPHFLFNTLSAIAGLIRPQPQAAEAMVTRLGELFRATLIER
ncbi:MAG: histidine kinase, partial [Steroidobacteraceae bacterium]